MHIVLEGLVVLIVEYLRSHLFLTLKIELSLRYIWIVALSTLNVGLWKLGLLQLMRRCRLHDLDLLSVHHVEELLLLLLILSHVECLHVISVRSLSLIEGVNFVILG